MKKILFLLALLCCHYVRAQNITINVTGSPDREVKVTYPVNGINYIYWGEEKTYSLGDKNSVQFANTLKTPGYLNITNDGLHTKIYVTPGKNLEIDLIGDAKSKTLKAKGPNAAGIIACFNLSHPFYQSKARFYFKQDSTAAGLKRLINQDIERELHPVDSLLKAKAITDGFYRLTAQDIRYYYASVFASVIFVQNMRTTVDHKRPDYKPTLNKDLAEAWPQIYKENPVSDQSAASASGFFYYAKDYTTWYKQYYLAKKNGTYQEINAQNYFDKFYDGFKANFTGKSLEYLLARFIFDEAMEKQYQPQLVKLYGRFTTDYPKSNFTPYITPLINEINAYQKRATQAANPEQVILSTASVNTFDQLLGTFKDKTVYVDMWATWCGPCKDEFQYSPDLRKYLKSKNVEMLYISMDNDAADKQWRDMIKYYDLNGNHARVNSALQKDLMNKFWDGKSYSIPRYVLVKNGVIVEKDAARPSDKQMLYEQISKHL